MALYYHLSINQKERFKKMRRLISAFMSALLLFLTFPSIVIAETSGEPWSTNNIADFDLNANEIAGGRWSYLELTGTTETALSAALLKKSDGVKYEEDYWVVDNNKGDGYWRLKSSGGIASEEGKPLAFNYTVAGAQAGEDLKIAGTFTRIGWSRLRILLTSDTDVSAVGESYEVLYDSTGETNAALDITIPSVRGGNDIVFEVTGLQFFWELQTLDVTISGIENESAAVVFPTNNITDFDLDVNEIAAGRWSYLSLKGDLTVEGLLNKGTGTHFATDEWAKDVNYDNHAWYVKADGTIGTDDGRIMAFAYTVHPNQSGADLRLNGTFTRDLGSRLRIYVADDTDSGAVGASYELIYDEASDASAQLDIVVPNVQAGNDIVFAVNKTVGEWWVGQNLNVTISEYTSPGSFPTNNIDNYESVNKVAPGHWSYLSLPGMVEPAAESKWTAPYQFPNRDLLIKGDGGTYAEDEWVVDNSRTSKYWYIGPNGQVSTLIEGEGNVPLAYNYTVAEAQDGKDLRIQGTSAPNWWMDLWIVITSDADSSAVGSEGRLLHYINDEYNASFDITIENVKEGNDILFVSKNYRPGNCIYNITISEAEGEAPAVLFPTNNIADYDLDVNKIDAGRWSYVMVAQNNLGNLSLLSQKGTGTDKYDADVWARNINRADGELVHYVKANGNNGADWEPVAYVYTVAEEQAGVDLRLEGTFRSNGSAVLRVVMTNDSNTGVIGALATQTTLLEKSVNGNTAFDIKVDGNDVNAGNDILFIMHKVNNDLWWEASNLNVSIREYISRVETIQSSVDPRNAYIGDLAELFSNTDPDVEIYYTTDNSDPATSPTSSRYSAPILLDRDITVKAYGKYSGMEDSPASTFNYVLNSPVRDFLGTNQGGDQSLGGLKWTREDFYWGNIFSSEGAVNQDALDGYKQKVLDNQKKGITMLPVLCYTANWAANKTGYTYEHYGRTYEVGPLQGNQRLVTVKDAEGNVVSEQMESANLDKAPLADDMKDAWVDYVEFVVETFSAEPYNLEYFQIWNEAYPTSGFWFGGMDDYIENIHIPAAEKIHELGKKVVYGGWICGAPVQELIDLLDKHDAWDTIDVHDLHYYPLSGMKLIHDEAVKRGQNSAVWQTELGFTNNHSFISKAYPKIFYWALENGMVDAPDLVKLLYFAWWAPDDPAGWAYQHTLMNGGQPSFHGQSVNAFANLLNGAKVEPFTNFTTDPGLKPEIDENLSAAEGFLVDGKKAVIALHMTEQMGTGLFTDLNGDGRTINLRDPNATIAVDISGASSSATVKRVDVLGHETALSAESVDGVLRVNVPIADTNADALAVNNASLTKTFYLSVESDSAIAMGSKALEPSSYQYALPADWPSTPGRVWNDLGIANLYTRSYSLGLSSGDDAYFEELDKLDDDRWTALTVIKGLLDGLNVRLYSDFTTTYSLVPMGNENLSAAEGFVVDGSKIVLAMHMVKQNDADLFSDWNGDGDSIHMSHDNPSVTVNLQGLSNVASVRRLSATGTERTLEYAQLPDGGLQVKVPISDEHTGAFMRTFYLEVVYAETQAVDKAALAGLIAEAEELDSSDYTQDSWSEFAAALSAANTVNDDADATQEQVDEAASDLQAAMDNLAELTDAVDKTALEGLIAEADELDSSTYTQDSWTDFVAALSAAKTVSADEDATQAEVDEAASSLQAAIDDLVELPPAIDKTLLSSLIAEVEAFDPSDYTEDSWSAFADALSAAKSVEADYDATQEQVDAAISSLQAAMDNLAVQPGVVDKVALAGLIAEADALDSSDYTQDSWSEFAAALSAAKTVNADADATQEQVDAAASGLQAAISNLVELPPAVDKTLLAGLIAEAEELDSSDYTQESWDEFALALSAANLANANADATQEQVDASASSLQAAIDNLVEQPIAVDKTELESHIALAETYESSDYTASSWSAFASALNAAKSVCADASATQAQVDAAASDLQEAMDNLIERPIAVDKTALNSQIARAETYSFSDYTASSWSAFVAALNAAKSVYADASATQSQVDAARISLQTSIGNLIRSISTPVYTPSGSYTPSAPSAPTAAVQIMPAAEASKTIQDAIAKGAAPVIVLGEKSTGVSLSGKDLTDNMARDKDLTIVNKLIELSIASELLENLKVTEKTSLEVILAPATKNVDAQVLSKLSGIAEVNKDLSKEVYSIGVKLDGAEVKDTVSPLKITVDVSSLELAPGQKANFTGILYDEELKGYRQMGGEFSEDGKTFTFYATTPGDYGYIVSDNLTKLALSIGSTSYTLNGAAKTNDVAPVIINDRTLLPLRVIAEALGAEVGWNEAIGTVTVTLSGKTATLVIGAPLPNGLGTPEIMNDRTYVPVRYIAEQLGSNVVWDGAAQTVAIYK
jgi:hypothetical protein